MKQCLLTNTFVPRKKKDPKLVVPSSCSDDAAAHMTTKRWKQNIGTGVLPSHIGPKIRHKKRSHDHPKNKQENIPQKVKLQFSDAVVAML